MSGQVARTGRGVLVEDVARDERVSLRVLEAVGGRSGLWAPLLAGDRVVGTLMALDRADGPPVRAGPTCTLPRRSAAAPPRSRTPACTSAPPGGEHVAGAAGRHARDERLARLEEILSSSSTRWPS
jgi:GAF domain-containing protein